MKVAYRLNIPNLQKMDVEKRRCEIEICTLCGGKFLKTRASKICLTCFKREYPELYEKTWPFKVIPTVLPTTSKENTNHNFKTLVGDRGGKNSGREHKPGQCLRCEIVLSYEEEGDGTYCGGCLNDLGRI